MATTIAPVAGDVQSNDVSQPPPSYSSVVAGACGPEAVWLGDLRTNKTTGSGRAYGPTPIGGQLLLPQVYYDVPHAMEEANHRARRRFFAALLWALGIWLLGGIIMGGSMVAHNHHRRH